MLLWDSFAALLFVVLNYQIPQLFTTNEEIISLASQMLIMVALYQVFDALQCAGVGILRGIQDVKVIPWISLLAYVVLNIPVGYLCGFVFGMGPCGLFLGYLFGLGSSAVLYLMRIRRKIHSFRREWV